MADRFGVSSPGLAPPPELDSLNLSESGLTPPPALESLCTRDRRERAVHTLGKAYEDLVRGLRGDYRHAPDVVAYPNNERDVDNILAWCADVRAAAIPFGGGSSVVRGIEPDVGDGYAGCVSVDLRHLDRVLEVDRASRSALIQGGVFGPHLEEQLKPHGLTLRHFPQSFEMSTLGGWIATRSGGHYATLFTHIDDFVEGVRAVTPKGVYETRRLPGSGAGPDPARLLIGSEGTLGVITQAWMRLQDRPRFRASAPFEFEHFDDAVGAARGLAQSGLWPANCRVLDQREVLFSGAGDGTRSLLIVTFESADHPLDAWFARAAELCAEFGGTSPMELSGTSTAADAAHRGAAGAWRNAFIAGGHRHDAFVRLGLIMETFETAITWDRFPEFHAAVVDATESAVRRVCGRGMVSCRFAYLYPDGPAPYYTVLGQARPGAELEQWAEIKAAASDALIAAGGTITHHHAVGRQHRPWYDRERPPLFAEVFQAARRTLDPAGIMNPGVLVNP
ncbi:MAG: FAD-binding oxidoreductase [Chloroflexi bacterium]|nr:FAD-binding oxidoreductase [Chloroflexota bacterium]